MLISEAAELLAVPARTLRHWCATSRIGVSKRAGARVIYLLSDADLVTLRTMAEERQQKRDRAGRFS